MEHLTRIHIERLPEGLYLATSDDIQGLVAQGLTVQETHETTHDVAGKLMESGAGMAERLLPDPGSLSGRG